MKVSAHRLSPMHAAGNSSSYIMMSLQLAPELQQLRQLIVQNVGEVFGRGQ